MTNVVARLSRRVALVLASCAMLLVAGCGGGGGTFFASGGIGGTGDSLVFATGVISATAPGAITVNGFAIDVGRATIRVNGANAQASALRVGMVVNVEATPNGSGGAIATAVDYRADIQGVVDGVDPTARAFTVLGQRVSVDARTVFDGGTFDTLRNQWVEVSGLRGTIGELTATRVEIRASAVGLALQVTGTVASLDPVARTFRLGSQIVDYASVAPAQLPAGLRDGTLVVVSGTQGASGAPLVASAIALPATLPLVDGARLEVEGLVTEFVSLASFRVNGQAVDARAATFDNGPPEAVVNGARIEVEGRVRGGVLVATRVEIEQVPTIAIEGAVETIDAPLGTLAVAGRAIRVDPSTQFQDLSAAAMPGFSLAALHVGDRVLVRAQQRVGGLVASRIERHDPSTPPPSATTTRVQGTISAFVSIADFNVGSQKVNAASARIDHGVAADLRDGRQVKVEGILNGATLLATVVELIADPATPPAAVEIEGAISSLVSVSSFRVAGQAVDASAARFTNGTAADLANGRLVTARGVLNAGVLRASQIEFHAAPPAVTLELEGRITDFASVASFRVEGQLVDATNARYSGGNAADLANGRRVHVKGPLVGGVVRAATVEIEDAEQQSASVEGRITDFVSVANFKVAGRAVDASAARFENGTAANLANGREVHVEGVLAGGVLRASKVEFE